MPTTSTLTLPNGETIAYQLERRPRRTVGMRISASGLVVHAPKRLSLADLEKMLLTKAGWISKKLEARHENTVPPIRWEDDATLLLLGNTITLRVEAYARNRAIQFNPPNHPPATLLLETPAPGDQVAISRKVQQWYRKYAMTDFDRRLEIFSTKLGVAKPALYLSSAKSRWGSCNSKKEVRLNWRLIQAPPHIINYVICHELAHLKEMNHSARFWAVVASIFPEYKRAESELKQLSAQLHAVDGS